MTELILGPMLRHVGASSATIWIEADAACTVEILGERTSTFSVAGHHYALVIIEGLEPGSITEYDVSLDGTRVWPRADSTFPPSVIRTVGRSPVRILFGSCRTAAPHEPPWTLEMSIDTKGRGVDAMRSHALRMMGQPVDQWPELTVFLGDQVYADDSSPVTHERVERRRAETPFEGHPAEVVGGFEEFTWLYHESWSPDVERWFFSVMPTTMIFDDHDMIDDWNISAAWVHDIRSEPWWKEHVVGGVITYWIYQHLGNLHPDDIRAEGMLDALIQLDDGESYLREWAERSERFTPVPGGYRFSFSRHLGDVKLVVIDTRNGRVLEPGKRSIVDDAEWDWIVAECNEPARHLLIGSSLPAFLPGGVHDLQRWNEAMCDGTWGRILARFGERVRRGLDLEDWPAFGRSFNALVELIEDVGGAHRTSPPATISILSGDIHFSYLSEIHFDPDAEMVSRVHQIVNSPIRNALRPFERAAMRIATSAVGARVTRVLRRTTRQRRTELRWGLDHGPVFDNCLGMVTFDGEDGSVRVERAAPDQKNGNGGGALEIAIEADLTSKPQPQRRHPQQPPQP